MAKTKTITIPVDPGLPYSGTLMDMDDKQFQEWAGGHLAVALFKGKFESELNSVIDLARVRGMRFYHERLLK